ncbi:MAG: hypothetical protein R3D85_01970 [Paracoccaceae bacterium]
MAAILEHVNVTVSDLDRSLALVQELFGHNACAGAVARSMVGNPGTCGR